MADHFKELEKYEALLKVNKHDLDNALIEQPDLYYHVAEQKAMAISRRDEAKLRLEEVEAQTDLDTREDFAKAGTKITEAMVANNVKIDKDVMAAQKALLDAKLVAERWSALAEAFSQRGYILKDLCALYISGYWGERAASGEGRNGAMERQAQVAREGSYSARRRTEQ